MLLSVEELAQARKVTPEEMLAVVEFLQGQGLTLEEVQKARLCAGACHAVWLLHLIISLAGHGLSIDTV